MKINKYNNGVSTLTSSATDKVKPKSNATPNVNTSKVQDSKPARARYIVNPVTGQYESTAYIPPKDNGEKLMKYIDKFKKENSYQPVIEEEKPFGSIINNLKNRNKPKEASPKQMAEATARLDQYRATNGYADHQRSKKKRIARELIKNFKPIEHLANNDIAKELQDVRDRSQRSAELEQQFQQLIKPRIDPDLTSGIASILKPKRSK
tara:strand:+ start:217 stop:840 length:624 start_codon:yes stop_codon:yes gene_type:complete